MQFLGVFYLSVPSVTGLIPWSQKCQWLPHKSFGRYAHIQKPHTGVAEKKERSVTLSALFFPSLFRVMNSFFPPPFSFNTVLSDIYQDSYFLDLHSLLLRLTA